MGRAAGLISDTHPPTDPKTTFTVGTMNGGTSVNAIAGDARMSLDIRSNDMNALLETDKQIMTALERGVRAENERWAPPRESDRITFKTQLVGDRPAGNTSSDAPIVQVAVRTLMAFGKGRPRLASTSYLSPPGAGSHGAEEGEASFPSSIHSWFFVDAVDMKMPATTALVVCLGDSITDGTNSTLNGDDRWPDQLQRRFSAAHPNGVAVVDAGIGSNRILSPVGYRTEDPFGGGPSALERLARDVIGLSEVKAVIWFEGINDLSNSATAEDVIVGLRRGVAMLREKLPGVRVIGATITPALGAKGNAGTDAVDKTRRQINDFIRIGGLYDGVVDFEKAVVNPVTGGLRPELVFGTTIGGPGDKLHPNRAGYLAMSRAIDLNVIFPSLKVN
jgi:lysophospholipase L1-like esterase